MGKDSQTLSRRNKWLLGVLTPCLLLTMVTGWLVTSTSGLQWLLGVAQRQSGGGMRASGVSGSLLESVVVQQLVLRGDGWRITVQGVQLQWQPAKLLQGKLSVLSLGVQQLDVLTLPSDTQPTPPDNLRLPFDMDVAQLTIDSLRVYSREGAAPDLALKDIATHFASDAHHFQLQALHAQLPFGDVAATAELGLDKPFALKAQATLDATLQFSGQTEHTHFVAQANGDLQHMAVKMDGNGAGMSVSATAQLAPLTAIPLSHIQATFSGMDTRRFSQDAPAAALSGSVELQGLSGGRLEGSLQLRNAHAAALDQNGLPLLGVMAQVRLSPQHWQLQQVDIQLPHDGHLKGALSWEKKHGKASAQLKVLNLDSVALDTRLPDTRLQGDITLDAADANQHAVVALSDGTLDIYGELKRQGGQLELSNVRLTRGETMLAGHGQMALDRRRTFRFSSQLSKLNLYEFTATPPTDLNANLEMSGALLPEVEGTVLVDLVKSQFAQYKIGGSGSLEFAGMRRATGDMDVQLGDNHLALNLLHGKEMERLQLKLDAPKLGQLGKGYGGQLSGQATLSGSVAEPRLQFAIHGQELSLPDGQRVDVLEGTGDLAFAAMQLKLGVTGYHSTGKLQLPQASVELQGSSAQHTLHASARIAQPENELGEFKLTAHGGLKNFEHGWQAAQWRGSLDELSATGVLPFHLTEAAPLVLAKEHVQLGVAEVAIGGGQIQFEDTQWTPQRWHSAGRFSGLGIRAVNMPQEKPLAVAFDAMRFGGAWDVSKDQHWQGNLQVQHESGDWVVNGSTAQGLGLSDLRLSLRAEQDTLRARLDASGERLGEISAQANVPMSRVGSDWTILPGAALDGHFHLRADDLSWLGPMLDSNLQSGGRFNFDADLLGTFDAPRLHGGAQGEALKLALLDQGIHLEQGELKVRFETDAVQVDQLAFSAPYQKPPRDILLGDYKLPGSAGQLSASGRIDLNGGSGDLQITAQRLPLSQRTDRWIIASGTGQASYAHNLLKLNGNIHADAGLINQPVSNRPSWSDDVEIIGQEPVAHAGPLNKVDATLDLGDHFYIRASGLEARLAGQLNVRSQPGEAWSVTGIIAAQDALFDAYGQRLQVDRGMVNFQGPLDDPGLNILALRKGLSVEAGVEVTGTVRHPAVHLVSTPTVPDAEKLSWIVLGRAPDSSGVDTSLLLAAAGNILGGNSVGQLGRALGVDELSLKQPSGTDPLQNQKVTVGKRLSARAYLSYEQGLSDVAGVTKFTYTLTPRITIVTRTGAEDALDLFYSFRYY